MSKFYTTECHKVGKKPMFVTCYTTKYGVMYQVFDNNREACDFSRELGKKGYIYDYKWDIPIERIEQLKQIFNEK